MPLFPPGYLPQLSLAPTTLDHGTPSTIGAGSHIRQGLKPLQAENRLASLLAECLRSGGVLMLLLEELVFEVEELRKGGGAQEVYPECR